MDSSSSSDEMGVRKGPWTPEEDEKLLDYIKKHGYGSWRTLPKRAGLNRCGKSCRLRWTNYLRPDIKRGNFSEEEERTIIKLHQFLGNKWSKIATHLPGRTDNEIKNYWNTHIRKKFLQMGIDPITHKPLPRTDFHLSNLLNISQLLCLQQFNTLMSKSNPLNTALKLQVDAAQIAQAQLLQNLLQIINSTKLPKTISDLLACQYPNSFQLEGLVNGVSATAHDFLSAQGLVGNPSGLILGDDSLFYYNNVNGISPSSSNSSDGQTAAGGQLPALVSGSPETSTGDQSGKSKTDDPSFDAWEKLMDDDETSGSYWKDLLDWTSSPSSPASWHQQLL